MSAIHDCPTCGEVCYCDLDDSNDARSSDDDCSHDCDGEREIVGPYEEREA